MILIMSITTIILLIDVFYHLALSQQNIFYRVNESLAIECRGSPLAMESELNVDGTVD